MKRRIIMLLAAWLLCALATTATAEDIAIVEELLDSVEEIRPEFDWDGANYNVFIGQTGVGGDVEVHFWIDESGGTNTINRPWATMWMVDDLDTLAELGGRGDMMFPQYITTMSAMQNFNYTPYDAQAFQKSVESGVLGVSGFTTRPINYLAGKDRGLVLMASVDEDGAVIEPIVLYSYDVPDATSFEGDAKEALAMEVIVDQAAVREIVQLVLSSGLLEDEALSAWLESGEDASAADGDPGDAHAADNPSADDSADAPQRMVRIGGSGSVNVRKESNTDSARVGTVRAGETYPLLSVADNGWYEIELADGTTGFVSGKLAQIVE